MKKLLNLFSIFTMVEISTVSVIACNDTNTKLTVSEEHNDIVNAINLKNKNNNGTNIQITDISNWNNPQYKNINKNIFQISYDVLVKQTANTFLNIYDYRFPEIKGIFNISLTDNKIKQISCDVNYLPNSYDNVIDNSISIITGTTNDFTLIMNSGIWSRFIDYINNYNLGIISISANDYLKNLGMYNPNVQIEEYKDNDQWRYIEDLLINKTHNIAIDDNYAVCIHIIRKSGQNFQIAYTNLYKNTEHNMPLAKGRVWLQSFAFQSSNDIYDNNLTMKNNKYIYLNKNFLLILNDIYASYKNNESYGKLNWKVSSISNLLKINKFPYDAVNLNYDTIAKLLMNLFSNYKSYNEIQDLLSNKTILNIYNGIEFSFDKNNNYLENKLVNVSYSNSKDDAIRYVKDHYDVKQLLSTFNTGKRYDVQFINSNGQSTDKYVVYNGNYSFNDYKNNINDVKKYFYTNYSDSENILDVRNIDIDHKWSVAYNDNKGDLQVIIYKYDSINATFEEFK